MGGTALTEKNFAIVGVADVSLGYGSPQILAYLSSLADLYGVGVLALEPDEVHKQPFQSSDPAVVIKRISTNLPPHSSAGRIAYILEAAKLVNRLKPRMLVIFCTYSLPILYKLSYKPDFVLYVSLESIAAYGSLDIQINRHIRDRLDLIVFPEENRARLDTKRCGFIKQKLAVVYNAAALTPDDAIYPASQRRERILYSGTLDPERTLAGYFLEKDVQTLPVDLYGAISGDADGRLRRGLDNSNTRLRYHGMIDAKSLEQVRRTSAFSLVMWAPTNENQLYACPNKFFESIADGVPPIAAPHPQMKMLLERYGCGILMDDWSLTAFKRALVEAASIFGTANYDAMVAACRTAAVEELNWEIQFKKIFRFLPDQL